MAIAASLAPTLKNIREMRIKGRRPKIFEKEAKLGWNTMTKLEVLDVSWKYNTTYLLSIAGTKFHSRMLRWPFH